MATTSAQEIQIELGKLEESHRVNEAAIRALERRNAYISAEIRDLRERFKVVNRPPAEEPKEETRRTPTRQDRSGRDSSKDDQSLHSGYMPPKDVSQLKTLLQTSYGIGLPLQFDDNLLSEAMKVADLPYRTDWAVFCTLLSAPERPLTAQKLEDMTGYNPGSVSGAIERLEIRNFIQSKINGEYVVTGK